MMNNRDSQMFLSPIFFRERGICTQAMQGSKLKKYSGRLLATNRKIIVARCKFGGKLALFLRFGTFFMMKAKQDKMKCLF